MERSSFFDALILGGCGILMYTVLSFVGHDQIDQILVGDNKITIMIPVILIMIGIIFRLEGMIQESNPHKFNKKDIDLKNKIDSELILRKYESMPNLTQQKQDSAK